jgi:hypothetical protein
MFTEYRRTRGKIWPGRARAEAILRQSIRREIYKKGRSSASLRFKSFWHLLGTLYALPVIVVGARHGALRNLPCSPGPGPTA